jgi:hypothetical protein
LDIRQLLAEISARRGHKSVMTGESPQTPKCGLALTFEILRRWDGLTTREREEISAVLRGPSSQKDTVIGHFRFYYDTTGNDAPSLLDGDGNPIPGTSGAFIDSAGICFNEAWDFEIGFLGYRPPPLESDSTYHVTVRVLGAGLYGQTLPEAQIDPGPPPRYRTTIEIDNTFLYVYYSSRGLPGLKVTAAHEFHHAIQIGSYAVWDADRYFYEITSTWMESMVFPAVRDYYQYLSNNPGASSQFSHPEVRFTASDGSIEYSRCIWGIFIAKRYSPALMRRTWEHMSQMHSLEALDAALSASGSSLRSALKEYAYWNANTGITSDITRFYGDGRDYPRMALASVSSYIPPKLSVDGSVQSLGSSYLKVYLQSGSSPVDSMIVIVMNLNRSDPYSAQNLSFSYLVTSEQSAGMKQLSNGYSVSLSVSDPQNWGSEESVPTVVQDVLVYPDPFIAHDMKVLNFLLPARTQQPTATLRVYNSAMEQVFSGDVPVISINPLANGLSWNGTDDRGNAIGSGVYVFVITIRDQSQYVGKFSVVR